MAYFSYTLFVYPLRNKINQLGQLHSLVCTWTWIAGDEQDQDCTVETKTKAFVDVVLWSRLRLFRESRYTLHAIVIQECLNIVLTCLIFIFNFTEYQDLQYQCKVVCKKMIPGHLSFMLCKTSLLHGLHYRRLERKQQTSD